MTMIAMTGKRIWAAEIAAIIAVRSLMRFRNSSRVPASTIVIPAAR